MQVPTGLVVNRSTNEATDLGSILGVAIFPGSGVADSKRSESRHGYSSAIIMLAVKSSWNFTLLYFDKPEVVPRRFNLKEMAEAFASIVHGMLFLEKGNRNFERYLKVEKAVKIIFLPVIIKSSKKEN